MTDFSVWWPIQTKEVAIPYFIFLVCSFFIIFCLVPCAVEQADCPSFVQHTIGISFRIHVYCQDSTLRGSRCALITRCQQRFRIPEVRADWLTWAIDTSSITGAGAAVQKHSITVCWYWERLSWNDRHSSSESFCLPHSDVWMWQLRFVWIWKKTSVTWNIIVFVTFLLLVAWEYETTAAFLL